jgi:hypothetical protein
MSSAERNVCHLTVCGFYCQVCLLRVSCRCCSSVRSASVSVAVGSLLCCHGLQSVQYEQCVRALQWLPAEAKTSFSASGSVYLQNGNLTSELERGTCPQQVFYIKKFVCVYVFTPLGRPRRTWEDNIEMDFIDLGWEGVDWIHRTQGRGKGWVVNTAATFRIPSNVGNFLNSLRTS